MANTVFFAWQMDTKPEDNKSFIWNSIINNAHGKANELPFDILQHRWPVEYRITNETIVREKRWDNLEAVLCDAISGCEEHSLNRAENMAISLDTDTLAFVAQNEKKI